MKSDCRERITKEDFEREYDRLWKWRDLWQRLSNRDSQVYPQKGDSGAGRSQNAVFLATLQTRDERVQRRARIADNKIRDLMRDWDKGQDEKKDVVASSSPPSPAMAWKREGEINNLEKFDKGELIKTICEFGKEIELYRKMLDGAISVQFVDPETVFERDCEGDGKWRFEIWRRSGKGFETALDAFKVLYNEAADGERNGI